jgi:hypothetical protein
MRVKKAFPDMELCEPGCRANGIQLPEKIVRCDCSLNDIANVAVIKDNALLDGVLGQALDFINSSNIMVLTCYKYIFKYFYRSIGGYITIILIIGHITSVLYFIFNRKIFVFFENEKN